MRWWDEGFFDQLKPRWLRSLAELCAEIVINNVMTVMWLVTSAAEYSFLIQTQACDLNRVIAVTPSKLIEDNL